MWAVPYAHGYKAFRGNVEFPEKSKFQLILVPIIVTFAHLLGNRAIICKARYAIKERFRCGFKAELGLCCLYPKPQKGGNSITVFTNTEVLLQFLKILEELITLLWDLLKSVNSRCQQFQREGKEAI